MQVLTLLSEAEPDEEGYVNYRRFASGAAHMIHSLVDVSHQVGYGAVQIWASFAVRFDTGHRI